MSKEKLKQRMKQLTDDLQLAEKFAKKGFYPNAAAVLAVAMASLTNLQRKYMKDRGVDEKLSWMTELFTRLRDLEQRCREACSASMITYGLLFEKGQINIDRWAMLVFVLDGSRVSYHKLKNTKVLGSFELKEVGSCDGMSFDDPSEAIREHSVGLVVNWKSEKRLPLRLQALDDHNVDIWLDALREHLAGWLHWSGEGSRKKAWKQRWFVLRGTSLQCYERDEEPQEVIDGLTAAQEALAAGKLSQAQYDLLVVSAVAKKARHSSSHGIGKFVAEILLRDIPPGGIAKAAPEAVQGRKNAFTIHVKKKKDFSFQCHSQPELRQWLRDLGVGPSAGKDSARASPTQLEMDREAGHLEIDRDLGSASPPPEAEVAEVEEADEAEEEDTSEEPDVEVLTQASQLMEAADATGSVVSSLEDADALLLANAAEKKRRAKKHWELLKKRSSAEALEALPKMLPVVDAAQRAAKLAKAEEGLARARQHMAEAEAEVALAEVQLETVKAKNVAEEAAEAEAKVAREAKAEADAEAAEAEQSRKAQLVVDALSPTTPAFLMGQPVAATHFWLEVEGQAGAAVELGEMGGLPELYGQLFAELEDMDGPVDEVHVFDADFEEFVLLQAIEELPPRCRIRIGK